MGTWGWGFVCGVAGVLLPSPAWGWGCGGHVTVQNPAPPDAAVLSVPECCQGTPPESMEGEFVPTFGTSLDSGEDTARARVPVSGSEEGGLLLGRASVALTEGAWRFVPSDTSQSRFTYGFRVDPELESTPPSPPRLTAGERVSRRSVDELSQMDIVSAYVEVQVETDAAVVAFEVYAVDGGARAGEPVSSGPSSYHEVRVGESPPDCQGRFIVAAAGTYDVRAAGYSPSGERGAWSEFTRVETPPAPMGCALTVPAGASGSGWAVAGALVALLLGRRRGGASRPAIVAERPAR